MKLKLKKFKQKQMIYYLIFNVKWINYTNLKLNNKKIELFILKSRKII